MLNMGKIVHVRIKDMQQNELTEIIYINMDKSQNNNVEQETSCKTACIIYLKVSSRQNDIAVLGIVKYVVKV